jgi:hypothetical protein
MLTAYPLLRTRSTAEVVAYIESVAGLSLSKVGGDAPGETVINGLWLKRLSFAAFRYGFEASIAPADDLSTYILSLPVRGSMRVAGGEARARIAPGMGVMLSPGAPLAVAYPQDLHRIVMRVAVAALTRQFALMTGRAPAAPLRFLQLDLVLGTPPGLGQPSAAGAAGECAESVLRLGAAGSDCRVSEKAGVVKSVRCQAE